MLIDTETIHLKEIYLYVPCKFYCYYRCYFQFDYKASVSPNGVMPALFVKALIERRLCEPSEQIVSTIGTHFENIPCTLTSLNSDSPFEVWELHGTFIRVYKEVYQPLQRLQTYKSLIRYPIEEEVKQTTNFRKSMTGS